MNRTKTTHALALVVAASITLAAAGAKVTTDFDKEYDFTIRNTYTWGEGTPASELNEKRIVREIEEQLASKGFTLVNEEGVKSDLIVVTHAATDKKTESSVRLGLGLGFGHVGVGASAPVGSHTVTVGSLVISITDAVTGDLVWQAHASGTIDQDPEKLEKGINKAIAKAFKKFPPKKKGK